MACKPLIINPNFGNITVTKNNLDPKFGIFMRAAEKPHNTMKYNDL